MTDTAATEQLISARLSQATAALRHEPRLAERLALVAINEAKTAGLADVLAQASLTYAHALRFAGEYERAVQSYAEARRQFQRLRRPVDAARTATGLVDCLRFLGRLDEAVVLARRARVVFLRHAQPVRAAVLDLNLGLLYFHQDDYRRALRYWRRALPTFQEADLEEEVAATQNNVANALTQMDQLEEAEQLYSEARAVYAARAATASVAAIDVNLGYLAFRAGRYGAAMALLDRASETFDALKNLPSAVVTRLDLIEVYLALNLTREAASLALEQASKARALSIPLFAGRADLYVGIARSRGGDHPGALRAFATAYTFFEQVDNQVWRGRALLARASALLGTGSPADARLAASAARTAAELFRQYRAPSHYATALVLAARAAMALLNLGEASRLADQAVAIARQLRLPWLLFDTLYVQGALLQTLGHEDAAYAAFVAAADNLERVREEIKPEELRIALLADKADLMQRLVLICLARWQAGDSSALTEALRYAELGKSRSLTDLLRRPVHSLMEDSTRDYESLTRRMEQLRSELNWLYSRLADTVEPDRSSGTRSAASARLQGPRQLQRRIARHEAELVRLRRRARVRGARQDGGDSHEPYALDTPGSALLAHASRMALVYYVAADQLLLFLLSAEGLEVHQLGPYRDVERLVERLQYQLRKFRLGASYVRKHQDRLEAAVSATLADLYNLLLAPVRAHLEQTHEITVLPHGALHYIPFQALGENAAATLVNTHTVTYAPNTATLRPLQEQVGAEQQPEAALLMAAGGESLPFVEREVASIRAILEDRFVTHQVPASEESFRVHAPQADLIHIAAHAVFRDDNPLFSSIQLESGWLTLFALQDVRLKARLVTLSSCETGASYIAPGDELLGFARTLLGAGAASLLVSLWEVDDRATAAFMERFYFHLARRRQPSSALVLAQQHLRRSHPHPYYWAPFILVGCP